MGKNKKKWTAPAGEFVQYLRLLKGILINDMNSHTTATYNNYQVLWQGVVYQSPNEKRDKRTTLANDNICDGDEESGDYYNNDTTDRKTWDYVCNINTSRGNNGNL